MKLTQLIKDVKVEQTIAFKDVDVKDVNIDSNQVGKGSLFICLKGRDFDGHEFIRQVESYGAVGIVCEKKLNTALPQIIVKDTRKAMSKIAGEFYGHADRKMRVIAVIGTNGKTTTTHLIKNVLEKSGEKCGVIGTLGTYYLDNYIEPDLTTPDPLVLHKTFAEMYDCGIKTVVMEVSAHAVYYDKVFGVKFYAGIFTNFTQDHLDFFGDMDSYKNAKLKFFKQNKCKFILSNSDDDVGRELLAKYKNVLTYGINNPADVFAIDVKCTAKGSQFVINLFDSIYDVNLKIMGKFNVYNALATASTCALLGIKSEDIINSLNEVECVEGRLQCVYDKEFKVFIDYAHTPDGLEKAINAVRSATKNRLICIFGCGGNRDKSKRKVMGKISANNADLTIITSDNPRFEEPMDIIKEIEEGVLSVSKKFISIEDREQAIWYCLDMAKQGDCVLIAGKGSEKYQETLGIKKPYNDKYTVEEYFRSKHV